MWTSNYIGSFDGTLIHYQRNQGKRHPTLVFIHGAGSNYTAWNIITQRFKDRDCITVDLRNHGLSGFGKYDLERATRDIAEVLVHEHVKEFVPIGMCASAPIALELARKFSARVKRIVLISPSGVGLSHYRYRLIGLARSLRLFLALFPRRKRLTLVDFSKRRPLFLTPFIGLKGIHIRDFARITEDALRHPLVFVRKPTLLITGLQDLLIKKKALRRILSKQKQVTHVALPTHHLVHSAMPIETATLIKRFVGG
jgi:pimeloyl-ACP methyl ester carboxylesterase